MKSVRVSRRAALAAMAFATIPPVRPGFAQAASDLPDAGQAGDIRVCLTDNPLDSAVVITTVSEASIHAMGESRVQHRSASNSDVRIERKNGAWTIGAKTLKGKELEIRPAASPGLWVNSRFYRGTFRLIPFSKSQIWVINVLPLEHYLCSVVDGEIPGTFHNEARKAQVVAARTYALRRRAQNKDREYDVWASPARDQNYHGYQYRDSSGRALAGESVKSRQAVRETLGQVLLRDGKLARTYYSACCGGVTSAGTTTFPDATEMKSVECGHCQECPRYRWSTTLTSAEISSGLRRALGRNAPQTFDPVKVSVQSPEDRQSVPKLTATDRAGKTLTVDTRAFRSALPRTDLFSVWFSVTKDGDKWRLDGIGHGHGVGLCQWGANGWAKEGTSFDAILKHYYPGAEVGSFQG
jgi:stage II sporulation protein D